MGKVDVVTSRALASLTELLELAEPWLSAGAVALSTKGADTGRKSKKVLTPGDST